MIVRAHPCRGAFTLVELLVVIILIMIIAGLAVAFLPGLGDSARNAQAASMLQQWILTAKQKALRDQVPVGIRLLPHRYTININGSDRVIVDPSQVRQCQYIEQPDDFTVSPRTPPGRPDLATIGQLFTARPVSQPTVPLTSVFIRNMKLTEQVAAGDYLEILGCGLVYKIGSVNYPPNRPEGGSGTELALSQDPRAPSAIPYDVQPTKNYRIIRAPRVTGDDQLLLPDPIIIDVSTNQALGNSLPARNADGSYDILFSPSGAVISPGCTTDSVNLWVRDASAGVRIVDAQLAGGNLTIKTGAPHGLAVGAAVMLSGVAPVMVSGVLQARYNGTYRVSQVLGDRSFICSSPVSSLPPSSDGTAVGVGGEQTLIAVFVRSGLIAAHPPSPGNDPYAFIKDGRTSGK